MSQADEVKLKGIGLIGEKQSGGVVFTKEALKKLAEDTKGKELPLYDSNTEPRKKIGTAKVSFDGDNLIVEGILWNQ